MANKYPAQVRFGFMAAICVAVLVLTGGCNRSATPETLVAQAEKYHQSGDEKAALIQLKNALKQAPDNSLGRQLLGRVYLAQGDAVSADAELRKALKLGASPLAVYRDLTKAMMIQGQYQLLLDQTTKLADSSADLLAQRGNAYLELGDSAKAQNQYERALAIKPDNVEALVGLGKRASIDHDWAGTAKYADQAIKAHPEDVGGWLLRADMFRSQGRTADALAAYDKSLQLQPANAGIHLVKANVEIRTGNFVEAAAELDRAQKIAPNNAAIKYSRALLQMSNGNYQDARETIQQVLSVAPENPSALLLAGYIHFQLGSLQQAEQNFKLFLEKRPADPFATKMLSATLLKNGQSQPAFDLIRPALASHPDDAQLLLLAGEAQTQLKNFQQSAEFFERANVIEPNVSPIHAAMGLNQLSAGDTVAALAELEAAAHLGSSTPTATAAQISIYLQRKQFDKAAAAAAEMVKREPKNPFPPTLQGRISLASGNRAEARKYFGEALRIQADALAATMYLVQMDVEDRQPALAKARLQKLLNTDKKNLQATLALASLEMTAGDMISSRKLLLNAASENPTSYMATKALAMFHLKYSEPAKAFTLLEQFQAAATNAVEQAERAALLGEMQSNAGKINEALQTYQRAGALAPDNPAMQLRIAALQGHLKNFPEAKRAAEAALQIDRTNIPAQVMLASLAAQRGEFDEALAVAHRLQAQQSQIQTGYALEGDILSAKKAPEPAIQAYEKALAHGAQGEVVRRLYAAQVAAGKRNEAGMRISGWLSAHPNDLDTRLFLGQEALREGQNALAIAQFEAVSEASPDNVIALNNLAWLYQQKGDPRALAVAQRALADAPANPAVLDTTGWILAEKGDTTKALALLEKAVVLLPASAEIRFHLARVLFKSGAKQRAKQELDRSLEQNKSFAVRADVIAFARQF